MKCPYCNGDPVLKSSRDVYGPSAAPGLLWVCEPCSAWVSCHKGTSKACGTLAKQPLREMRRRVHRVLDPIWKSGKTKRNELYKMLAAEMGLQKDDCHVGLFGLDACRRALVAISRIKRRLGLGSGGMTSS